MKNFKSKVILTIFCGSFSYIAFANANSVIAAAKPQATALDMMALQVRSAKIVGGKNSTTYSGNVEISRGNFVIKADTAVAQKNKFMISGNPAKFTDIISAKQNVGGFAKSMNFDANANQLTLVGNAFITKNGKTEKDKQQIVYNTTTHEYK